MVSSNEDIENILMPVIDDLAPKLKQEIKEELTGPLNVAWHAILLIKSMNMIPVEAAEAFLKEKLKISTEAFSRISIKQAYKLGRGDSDKLPPFLRFGHPSDRNTILSHSKNLAGFRIRLERHIPKCYQEKYKEFKKLHVKSTQRIRKTILS